MILRILIFVFFFFKQKTAYEMRISDWSSDVCSSDLRFPARKAGDPCLGRSPQRCRRHQNRAHQGRQWLCADHHRLAGGRRFSQPEPSGRRQLHTVQTLRRGPGAATAGVRFASDQLAGSRLHPAYVTAGFWVFTVFAGAPRIDCGYSPNSGCRSQELRHFRHALAAKSRKSLFHKDLKCGKGLAPLPVQNRETGSFRMYKPLIVTVFLAVLLPLSARAAETDCHYQLRADLALDGDAVELSSDAGRYRPNGDRLWRDGDELNTDDRKHSAVGNYCQPLQMRVPQPRATP